MKSLLLSCRNFESKIKKLATRPEDIEPEPIEQKEYRSDRSIVCLICVEEGDDIKNIPNLLKDEIIKFSDDTKIRNIIIFPFGHLSNKIASSKETKKFLNILEKELIDFNTTRIHFGSHKSLLLDIYGHKGNVRFREF